MTFKESILVFLTKNEKGHTKQAKKKSTNILLPEISASDGLKNK